MTHLALQFLSDPAGFFAMNGMWIFLAVGAIALFGIFLPATTWMDHQRKEREAFYKAETFRRIAEAPGDSGKAAIALLQEQERMKAIKTFEGLKLGGLINLGVGIGLVIFLRALVPAEPVYLCGLIPGLVGVALLVYVYGLAKSAY